MRIRWVLSLGSVFAASAALAAFTPSAWQYRKPISVQQTGYVRLNLDAEAFAGLQPDLRDLRVVDGSGQEVPFKLVVEREDAAERRRPVSVLNNSYTPGQYQSFMVDLGVSPQTHNWLHIITPEENFQKLVEISGSADAQAWQVLRSEGYIFGHTEPRRGFATQQTTLTYPTATFRYVLVKIFSDTPFGVTGAEVTERVAASAKEIVFSPVFTQTEDVAEQTSVVTLDFGQGGLPTNAVQLVTDTTMNFDRPAEIFSSDDGRTWRKIGSAYLFRITQPRFTGGNFTLRYGETAARYLRIFIYNGDDQPITFFAAVASGILRSVVFNANADQSYFLYYSNPSARYPAYDLERIFPYLEVPQIPGATLAVQEQNPAYMPPAPPVVPFTERYPWLLPSVLVVIALVLLGFILRFVKQVKR